jgi:hypothetical protein
VAHRAIRRVDAQRVAVGPFEEAAEGGAAGLRQVYGQQQLATARRCVDAVVEFN